MFFSNHNVKNVLYYIKVYLKSKNGILISFNSSNKNTIHLLQRNKNSNKNPKWSELKRTDWKSLRWPEMGVFMTSQMLWPLATTNCNGLEPRIDSLKHLKCLASDHNKLYKPFFSYICFFWWDSGQTINHILWSIDRP